MDTRCALCQREDEKTEHVVLAYAAHAPSLSEGATDLAGALEFSEEDGRMDGKCGLITKERWEGWWKVFREN